MKTFNSLFFNTVIKYGLMLGVVLSAVTLLMYILEIDIFDMMLSSLIFLVNAGLTIVFMVVAVKEIRKKLGTMPFGQKFITTLSTGFVGYFLSGIVGFVLYRIIDPEYMDGMMEGMIEKQIEMLESRNVPDEVIDEMLQSMGGMMEIFSSDLGYIFSTLGNALIYPAIVGVIVAGIVKSQDPNQIGETNI